MQTMAIMDQSMSENYTLVQVGKKILLTFSSKSVSAFGTIFILSVISKTLGLDAVGQFSTASAIMLGIVVISNFGNGSLIQRDVAILLAKGRFGDARAEYLGCVKSTLIVSSPLALALVLYSVFYSGSVLQLCFALSAPGVAILVLNASVFRAHQQSSIAPFLEFGFNNLVSALIILSLVTFAAPITLPTLAIIILCTTYAVLFFSLALIHYCIPQFWTSSSELRFSFFHHPQKSFDFFALEFAQYFSQWGLIVIISYFETMENVGIFATILKISFLVNFILGVTSNTVSAKIASLHAEGRFQEMYKLRSYARLTMLSIAIPAGLFLLIFQHEILAYFKIAPVDASAILYLLLAVQVLNVATGMSPIILKMIGGEKQLRNIVLFTLLMQISFVSLFTWSYGLVGAAIAFGSSLLTKNFLSVVVERRIRVRNFNEE